MGLIAVADLPKISAKAGVAILQKLGIAVYMITGDNQRTARAIATELGIENVLAEVLPDQKKRRSESCKSKGKLWPWSATGLTTRRARGRGRRYCHGLGHGHSYRVG